MNKAKVDVRIETINPEVAKSYLAKSGKNRHITKDHLDGLVRDMKNDQWVFNGDPIRFNGDKLIDGQHRLTALIQSGKTFDFVVVRELPREAFDTIDIGKKRTTADYLSIAGESYSHLLAPAARYYLAYKRYQNLNTKEPITNADKLNIIRATPQLASYVHGYASSGRLPIKVSVSLLAALHLLFWEKNRAAADEFMEGFIRGSDLANRDPRLPARNWIIRKPPLRGGPYIPWRIAIGNLIIRAWNAWRSGETLVKVQPMKEPPIIK
jgi:hypothetical protein